MYGVRNVRGEVCWGRGIIVITITITIILKLEPNFIP
jgi:hypothetical protein